MPPLSPMDSWGFNKGAPSLPTDFLATTKRGPRRVLQATHYATAWRRHITGLYWNTGTGLYWLLLVCTDSNWLVVTGCDWLLLVLIDSNQFDLDLLIPFCYWVLCEMRCVLIGHCVNLVYNIIMIIIINIIIIPVVFYYLSSLLAEDLALPGLFVPWQR